MFLHARWSCILVNFVAYRSQVKHAIKRKVYTEAGVPHTNIQQNLKFTTKKRVTSSSALKSPSDNSKVPYFY